MGNMDITQWFNTKVEIKDNTLPRYFILNSYDNAEFEFNINKSDKYETIANIKWKLGNHPLKILRKKNKEVNHTFPEVSYSEKTIPILKSNLQKCIRRSKEMKAVATAYLMLNIDPSSILRRLPIIYIEDVHIDISFATIVWYMIAVSKNYKLK